MSAEVRYFHELVEQMEEVGVKSTDNVQIIADDGQPAMVIVKRGNEVLVFVQNETMSELERKTSYTI